MCKATSMGGTRASEASTPPPARLNVTLAGDVSIWCDDTSPVRITRRQDRVVLARLVLGRPTPVSRDTLAAAVWPKNLPLSFETALRGAMSRLRAALRAVDLPGDPLVATRGKLRFEPPETVEIKVDVEEAESLLVDAERVSARDPATARSLAAEARRLLEAPFLADCDGHWVESQRRWLHGLRLRAMLVEAEAALEASAHDDALQAAHQALDADPYNERAHRVVITAHRGLGDRAAALDAYGRCFRLLRDDLGIAPGRQVEAAYLEVLGTEPTATTPMSMPFVGRDRERGELAAAWRRVFAGSAEAVMIVGDSGIGKTRLAEEVARSLAAVGALVLQGREDAVTTVPYRSVAEAFADYVDRRGTDRLASLGSVTQDLARLWPRLSDHLSVDATPGIEAGPGARWRLFDAVASWLVAAAAVEPVVLILDDLHWASPSTLQLLAHLLVACADSRVLVIGTRRPIAQATSEQAEAMALLRRRSSARELSLEGLAIADVGTLVGEVLEIDSDVDDAVTIAKSITERSGGNALLVTELLRRFGAEVRRRRVASGGSVDLPECADGVVPAAVDDLIGLRLAALGNAGAAIVRLAALAGSRTPSAVIEAAHGDRDAVQAALGRAAADGVVNWDGDWVEFAHEIVRDSIARGITADAAAVLHRDLAEAAEEAFAGEDVVFLAHHWSLAVALGFVEAMQAHRWCLAAGRQAMERSDFDRAAEHFTDAREALAVADPIEAQAEQWCDVRTLEGEALHAAGNADHVRAFTEAIVAARRLGDAVRLARAALGLSDLGISRSLSSDSGVLIAALREAHDGLGDAQTAVRARVQATLALELRWSATHAELVAMADRAVELAESSGDPSARAAALICRAGQGDLHPTIAASSARVIRDLGDQLMSAPIACHAAVIGIDAAVERGAVDDARAELALLDRIVARVPLPYVEWVAMTRRAGLAALVGDHDQALETMAYAGDLGLAIGLHPTVVAAGHAGLHLSVALETGDLEVVIARLVELEPFLSSVPSWHASMAVALAESGDPAAHAHLDVVVESVDSLHGTELAFTTLVNGARAAARLGDARTRRFVPLLRVREGHLNWASCVSFGPIDLALAWIAGASGDRTAAKRHLDRAAELCRRPALEAWSARIESERALLV